MAEFEPARDWDDPSILAVAAVDVKKIWQLPYGGVGYFVGGSDGRTAGTANRRGNFRSASIGTVPLTSGVTLLAGQRVFMDYSTRLAHYKKVDDRDHYLGRCVEDTSSNQVLVAENWDPPYDFDFRRDPMIELVTGTQALGGFLPPRWKGGSLYQELSATNEAQIVYWLGQGGWDKTMNGIYEWEFNVEDDGSGTVVDIDIGMADGGHATSFASVSNYAVMHLDANDVNIYFGSTDGTTTVPLTTDSTIDYTAGTTVATRVFVTLDFRDPTSLKFYVNGARVLSGTTFGVNATSPTWKPIFMMEKTASTDTYKFWLHRFTGYTAEQ